MNKNVKKKNLKKIYDDWRQIYPKSGHFRRADAAAVLTLYGDHLMCVSHKLMEMEEVDCGRHLQSASGKNRSNRRLSRGRLVNTSDAIVSHLFIFACKRARTKKFTGGICPNQTNCRDADDLSNF